MTSEPMTQAEKIKRGAEDSGIYFRRMMEFVGFTPEDALAVRDSGLVVEKHLPRIVSDFYTHLLRYPPTRKFFIGPDGALDMGYLEKRMLHLTNFWRRTASGEFDDEYARYVDYVGRAHTSRGADPNIYIAERYVIGQVGFIQHAISSALREELNEYDPDLEKRATRAWNLLLMVILEMLARAYNDEHVGEGGPLMKIDHESMHELAVETYERGLGLTRPQSQVEIRAGEVKEIPEGERKLIQSGELSIGLFHHQGQWYALHNHCLHRGGPVATGKLEGDVLTCPWHGYQYDVTTGQLLVDPASRLEMYPVEVRDGAIYLSVPEVEARSERRQLILGEETDLKEETHILKENEFLAAKIPPGKIGLVQVAGQPVAVYNVGGQFFATSSVCTHDGGPLNEGDLSGTVVECPWHGSCFDVTDGSVKCEPAETPLKTYSVSLQDGVGSVA